MAFKEHSEDEVAQVQAMVRSGMSDKRAAQVAGVGRDTVRRWTRDGSLPVGVDREAVAEKAGAAQEQIAQKLEVMVPEMLEAARAQIPTAKFKDLLIGVGIGIEKLELLRGRPTGRSESTKIVYLAPTALAELSAVPETATPPLDSGAIEGQFVEETDKSQ